MSETTWRKLFEEARDVVQDTSEIEATTLTDEQWDEPFDNGYGGPEGCAFTIWTRDWAYFPIMYDGAEWVGRAPRHPCGIAMEHQGG